VVESVVGPHRGNESEENYADSAEDTLRRGLRRKRRRKDGVLCAEEESTEDDQNDGPDFDNGEEYLNSASQSNTEIVDGGHDNDDNHGERLGQGESEIGRANVKRMKWRCDDREDEGKKAQKCSREAGHGDGAVEEGVHPAEEETPERAEPFGEVNV